MSARQAVTFQAAFDAFAASLNLTPAQVVANAAMQANLLRLWNRSYKRGYIKRAWEDAWSGATVVPANRLIGFDAVSDARRFEVWDTDPRKPDNGAQKLRYTTTGSGILLTADQTSVFVLSMPKEPTFTTTAWSGATTYALGALVLYTDGNVYRSLQAGNLNKVPTAEAAWWVVVPVLAILEDFTICFARGTYWLENGRPEQGGAERADALAALDELAMTEYCRTAHNAWKPTLTNP